jgi:hypothetical protein
VGPFPPQQLGCCNSSKHETRSAVRRSVFSGVCLRTTSNPCSKFLSSAGEITPNSLMQAGPQDLWPLSKSQILCSSITDRDDHKKMTLGGERESRTSVFARGHIKRNQVNMSLFLLELRRGKSLELWASGVH